MKYNVAVCLVESPHSIVQQKGQKVVYSPHVQTFLLKHNERFLSDLCIGVSYLSINIRHLSFNC